MKQKPKPLIKKPKLVKVIEVALKAYGYAPYPLNIEAVLSHLKHTTDRS